MTTPLPDLIARLRSIVESHAPDSLGASDRISINESITHLERLALLEAAVTNVELELEDIVVRSLLKEGK